MGNPVYEDFDLIIEKGNSKELEIAKKEAGVKSPLESAIAAGDLAAEENDEELFKKALDVHEERLKNLKSSDPKYIEKSVKGWIEDLIETTFPNNTEGEKERLIILKNRALVMYENKECDGIPEVIVERLKEESEKDKKYLRDYSVDSDGVVEVLEK
jgi:hypothetical protein